MWLSAVPSPRTPRLLSPSVAILGCWDILLGVASSVFLTSHKSQAELATEQARAPEDSMNTIHPPHPIPLCSPLQSVIFMLRGIETALRRDHLHLYRPESTMSVGQIFLGKKGVQTVKADKGANESEGEKSSLAGDAAVGGVIPFSEVCRVLRGQVSKHCAGGASAVISLEDVEHSIFNEQQRPQSHFLPDAAALLSLEGSGAYEAHINNIKCQHKSGQEIKPCGQAGELFRMPCHNAENFYPILRDQDPSVPHYEGAREEVVRAAAALLLAETLDCLRQRWYVQLVTYRSLLQNYEVCGAGAVGESADEAGGVKRMSLPSVKHQAVMRATLSSAQRKRLVMHHRLTPLFDAVVSFLLRCIIRLCVDLQLEARDDKVYDQDQRPHGDPADHRENPFAVTPTATYTIRLHLPSDVGSPNSNNKGIQQKIVAAFASDNTKFQAFSSSPTPINGTPSVSSAGVDSPGHLFDPGAVVVALLQSQSIVLSSK